MFSCAMPASKVSTLELAAAIAGENRRQEDHVELIAVSEN